MRVTCIKFHPVQSANVIHSIIWFKKKTTAKEEGLYSSSPETEKPKETSPLFAQFSATPSLQWISACSEDALDGVRYSPELSRFSWELETEI